MYISSQVKSQLSFKRNPVLLLTDFVCLYTYEFWLSLCKIVRSSVILLLPLFTINIFNTSLYSLGVQCDRYIAWLSIVSGDYRWWAFRSTWYFCVCESSCCSKLFHFPMYYSLIALQIAEASCFISQNKAT